MSLSEFTPLQWSIGALVAVLVGFSKTGMPGVGILVVPLMASIFGARPSIGALLLLLIAADCFAVAWYKQHADWAVLRQLIPWVLVGMAVGGALLFIVGERSDQRDLLNPLIGWMVLLLLALQLLRGKLGDRLRPTSPAGTKMVGVVAGVSTTVSNAGGPVMAIYFTAAEMPKERFMGTSAWYFFILNCCKLPVFVALTLMIPAKPVITWQMAAFDAVLLPAVALGALSGRWALDRIPQKVFEATILVLAAVAAVNLVLK